MSSPATPAAESRVTLDDGEASVLDRIQRLGDAEAADLLRHRFGRTVFRIVRLTLGPRPDLARLAREIFTRAVQKARATHEQPSAKRIVLAATVLVCQQAGRKASASPNVDAQDAPEDLPVMEALRDADPNTRPELLLDLIEVLEATAGIPPLPANEN